MNGRSMIVLVVAMVCGLGAMIVVNQMMAPSAGQTTDEVQILVAARDLNFQEVLNKEDLVKTVSLPRGAVPAGSFRSYQDIADRWVMIKMLADEPILEAKLARRDAPRGITAAIPAGMRAVGVEVNEQSGVSGFIQPQSHVDVILAVTSSSPGRSGQPEAMTILQDVLVLASGSNLSQVDDKAATVRTVTLALSPEQIEVITAAKARGSLSLALRPINDHKIEPARPKPAEEVTILVAARDLEAGHEIFESMVRPMTMPRDEAPPGSFQAFREINDRWILSRIPADRPITADQLAPLDLKSRITTGMRAVSIEVDERTGVAGFVKPDDRVDILREEKDEGSAGRVASVRSQTLLRDIRVLAIGQTFTASPDGAAVISKSVTVELTPNQVEILNSAHAQGRLTLALRGSNEQRGQRMAHVVVATRDLAVGTVVTPEMVTLEELPAEHLPPDALVTVGEVIGRQARRPVTAATPLVGELFAATVDCAKIRDGFRGVTVQVAEHAAALQVCDHVDVIWADGRAAPPRAGGPDADGLHGLLLENSHICEIRPVDPKDPSKPGRLVVLEVPADKVAAIALAGAGGPPTIVRRGPGDVQSIARPAPAREVAVQGALHHGPRAVETYMFGRRLEKRPATDPSRQQAADPAPAAGAAGEGGRPCCLGRAPGLPSGSPP